MITLVHYLLWAVVLLLLIPSLVMLVECLAAWLLRSRRYVDDDRQRPRVAVIVPAHNEELKVADTIATLAGQLDQRDRLIVVADNCTDMTATCARNAGAEVVERSDTDSRGKGFALAAGIQHVASNYPDVLVIIDADCSVQARTIERITKLADKTGCPVQSRNWMELPSKPSARDRISAFAWATKNVRAAGLARLGAPCWLMGTGMAIPWQVINEIKVGTDNIAEDLPLGYDLSLAGHPPLYFEPHGVISQFPEKSSAAKQQRTRWEHGFLSTMAIFAPKLLLGGLLQRRPTLVFQALDVAVPPLSMLVLVLFAASLSSMLFGVFTGAWLPLAIVTAEFVLLAIAVLAAWLVAGREFLNLRTLLAVPVYLLWKAPIYLAFLLNRQKTWVRTDRDNK